MRKLLPDMSQWAIAVIISISAAALWIFCIHQDAHAQELSPTPTVQCETYYPSLFMEGD
jgi:hypothetical protein